MSQCARLDELLYGLRKIPGVSTEEIMITTAYKLDKTQNASWQEKLVRYYNGISMGYSSNIARVDI